MERLAGMTQYIVLSELRQKEMHGYDIMATLEKLTDKKPSPGQIYPLLKQLKSLGYVTIRVKSEGRKKLKFYKMTPLGRKFFESMNHRFESWIKAALKSRIKMCAHCSCEILSGGYNKTISGRRMHFCCISCASSFKSHR